MSQSMLQVIVTNLQVFLLRSYLVSKFLGAVPRISNKFDFHFSLTGGNLQPFDEVLLYH